MSAGFDKETVCRLETNLDDLSPEITGAVIEDLFAAGALDVWLTPIHMKKNRPGTLLSLLCKEESTDTLAEILFRNTSAFGVRVEKVDRFVLGRRFESVETEFGTVKVKLGLKGAEILQVAPEFESCRALSRATGKPLRAIYHAAIAAFSSAQTK
jgi:uncharacterized protein (DUF111 family)